jgi:3-methylcrotonyl-CoA carboxylase alpha subunit
VAVQSMFFAPYTLLVNMRAFRKSTHLSRQLLATNGVRYNSTIAPATKPLTSVLIANRGEIAL